MEEKLQEKFALVQLMKREKELKEAKAKENQVFDIFALAGVNIPTGGVGGVRNDTAGKRTRAERSTPSDRPAGVNRTSSHASAVTSPRGADDTTTNPGTEKKLKRSSMAMRNATQSSGHEDGRRNAQNFDNASSSSAESVRGRQLSIISVASSTSTPSHNMAESPITATPPTPIPSPRNESSTKQDTGDKSQQRPVQRVRDMTHNLHSRAGSVDENEEMVLDMYGRSIPRSRHQSSDEGSDYGNDSKRREGDREYERDRRSDYGSYRADGPGTSASEADPYLAASRYLDTAFYPTKIYVGNLPESISLTSLRTAFGPFGDIEDMNLVEGKDFGFVTYKEPEAAKMALEQMNGIKLDGTEIRVNRAKIPERNRNGFAGVAWMDEDGELARMEEEQHKQAAAIAKTILGPGSGSHSVHTPLASPPYTSGSAAGAGAYGTRGPSSPSGFASPDKPLRPIHQLPPRPRSPKLPPKPTTAFPPVGVDPRAAIAARGGGRQILKYDDL
ncbi:RNA-binding protein 39 [Dissophora ornata]|nr:RNA-binding protein 39 [Dissophora ornata]